MVKKGMVLLAAAAAVLVVSLGAAADVPAPLLAAYLKVQTDLAGDQLAAATANAKAVAAEAAKAGTDAAAVRAAAEKVAAADKIESAREAFGALSDAMIALAGGKAPNADVKIAYCPMVRKSWLQQGEKIQNPYFGKSMLTCGEIRK
jgi:membrane fusion protein, copper/silver efflux system